MTKQTQNRKIEHLQIGIKENVQFKEKTTGLEKLSFKNTDLKYLIYNIRF